MLLVVAMCFLPADISLDIGPFHFYAVRIIGLCALLKIYSSAKRINLSFNAIDKLFIAYNILGALIYVIASENTSGAFIYVSGTLVDSIVVYVVLRYTIQSEENVLTITKTFGYCVLVLLPFAAFEYFNADNLFSFLGRSRIEIRDGEIRVACTFSHSILFGSFAASLVPILWGDYKYTKSSTQLLSIACCLFFIYVASSSGPLVTLAVAIAVLIFFQWKKHSSFVAWSLFLAAIAGHLVRESPIWHLFYVRLTLKASSTGYHRYLLTNAAVKEFWNWWLLGYGDIGPDWHKYWPWTHASGTDVTNYYLLLGVRGGFFTMLLFMILCFKIIKVLGSYAIFHSDPKDQWLWWGFSVMMISHCVTFLSVAYFGQITMLLYLTIAVAAYVLDESLRKQEPSVIKRRFVK